MTFVLNKIFSVDYVFKEIADICRTDINIAAFIDEKRMMCCSMYIKKYRGKIMIVLSIIFSCKFCLQNAVN